jgi:hypothetical protein
MGIQHGVVNLWTRVGDGELCSNPGRAGNVFISIMHSLDLGPTQPPVHWARGFLAGGKQLSNECCCASPPHVCFRDLDRDNLTFNFTFTFQNIRLNTRIGIVLCIHSNYTITSQVIKQANSTNST